MFPLTDFSEETHLSSSTGVQAPDQGNAHKEAPLTPAGLHFSGFAVLIPTHSPGAAAQAFI